LVSVRFVSLDSASRRGGGFDRLGALMNCVFFFVVGPASQCFCETKVEGAALASVPSVGVGSGIHCGVGHDSRVRCSGLCSLGRRRLNQPLGCRKRKVRTLQWFLFARSACAQPATVVAELQVRALLWSLFDRLACAQPATAVAGKTGEGAALESDPLKRMGSASH
jgi:hypothetical protein